MSLGKFVMNLIRSMPGISWRRQSRSESRSRAAVGLAVLVTVDRLTDERDLLHPLLGELPGLVDDDPGGRLCSGPRTDGTMQ